jgi:hypothetical protein
MFFLKFETSTIFGSDHSSKMSICKLNLNGECKKWLERARRRGLVVRVNIHVQEVVSSNPGPAAETIYHAPLIWIKSMKAKIVEKLPGTVACAVILQRGGWSLRMVGL